jgi:predicted lipid-binding transport protein (Tim44 family)
MDILFLAILTFYIFFKLSKHLGKIDEEEKKQIEEKVVLMKAAQAKAQSHVQDMLKQQEKLVGAASTANNFEKTDKVIAEENKLLSNLDETNKRNLEEILSRCNINLSFFLTGAKSAFEIVIKSFAAADLGTLKMLLSDKLYQGFEAAINQRKTEEKILTTNLISLEKCEIISALTIENNASIAVKFVSKQINYISSKTGEIIEGKKDEIVEVTDVWTFKKDITSPNPNWVISATGA